MSRASVTGFHVWLLLSATVGCGSDSPVAPTTPAMPTGPTAPAPIVVTLSARIVPNVAPQGITPSMPVENRNLRIDGEMTVTGGRVTVAGTVTFIPRIGQEVVVDFLNGDFPPGIYNAEHQVPYDLPPGAMGGGTIRVDVTGADANGGPVSESIEVDVPDDATTLPPFHAPCIENDKTLCLDEGRFQVDGTWSDSVGQVGDFMVTPNQRFFDGGWFQIAGDPEGNVFDPGGFDVFIQGSNNCAADQHYGFFVTGRTDVGFTMTVTDTQANQTKTYSNPLGMPAAAITDTQAFATCP